MPTRSHINLPQIKAAWPPGVDAEAISSSEDGRKGRSSLESTAGKTQPSRERLRAISVVNVKDKPPPHPVGRERPGASISPAAPRRPLRRPASPAHITPNTQAVQVQSGILNPAIPEKSSLAQLCAQPTGTSGEREPGGLLGGAAPNPAGGRGAALGTVAGGQR